MEQIETHQEIAKAAGVGRDTVRKVEAVLNSDNEAIKAAMLSPKSDPKHVMFSDVWGG